MSPGRSPAAAGGEFRRAMRAAKFVLAKTRLRPRVAVVLGSGLGEFADGLSKAVRIPYAKIPHFPRSSVPGHAGRMVIGRSGHVEVAAMQGRAHLYEGYTAAQVAFPIRVLARMGVRALVLTNAAGGIDPGYGQGALVLIRDHLNLQGTSPLIGPHDERFGPRFPDMTEAYSKSARAAAFEEAGRLGLRLREGVYAAMHGPSYETPAEIRALRSLGADLVGMSTVPEVIAARQAGLRVLAVSCVTNLAAGILGRPIDHAEVLRVGEQVKDQLVALLRAVIPRLVDEPDAPAKKELSR
ncbi:MAG TPA: purine-nucleoside phosphorylase [Candidatus Acidoferrales bacterium]|nr:purine-nucleoside phosphorylase [Candidatus Acidoferrales bacterium]